MGAFLPVFLLAAAAVPSPAPDPKAVDAAVDRGVQYLLGFYAKHPLKTAQEREFILYALLHAGVKPTHPLFQRLLPEIERGVPRNTYAAAVALMLFHRLDPLKYRLQIARAAAFLVQNQCANGQWGYAGNPVPLRSDYEAYEREAPYLVYGGVEERVVAQRLRGFRIPPQPDPRRACAAGDNSNTQYAILGLRAAAESGCLIPEETWKRTAGYLGKSIGEDGSLCYNGSPRGSAASREYVPLAGTHTMTTAGAAMLAICDFYLKRDPASDPVLQRMQAWLDGHFDVRTSTSVFCGGDQGHYYYLYGLERMETLLGQGTLGGKDWYAEGAAWLLSRQAKDGSWRHASRWPDEVNVAFALLFLRRSTLPLVPEDRRREYEVAFAEESSPRGK